MQGFPKDYCNDLTISQDAITDDDMIFWRAVFGTDSRIRGVKTKSDNQIKKWLSTPHGDSSEYIMWGNGVALPCVEYILQRIVEENSKDNNCYTTTIGNNHE